MIEKVNLLKQNNSLPEEGFTIDAIVSQANLGGTPLNVNQIMVKPGMESVPYESGRNKDTLYFFEGTGKITVGQYSDTVESGDRVIIPSNHQYVITNDSDKPLHVLQIVT